MEILDLRDAPELLPAAVSLVWHEWNYLTDETLGGRNRWFGDAIKERRLYRLELRVKF